MIGCIIGPYFLAVFNFNHAFVHQAFTNMLLNITSLPFTPLLLVIIERKTYFELNHCAKDQLEQLLRYYLMIKMETARMIRTELCLESALQILFGILIIVFSRSKTRTAQGLEGLMEGKDLIFGINPDVFLTISIILSAFTAWRSYVKGLSQTKDHFPFKSKAILGLYVGMSLGIKIVASLMFLAPALGLFNILTHFQGELLHYWTAMNGPRADEHFPKK